jgi:hypothetical protein
MQGTAAIAIMRAAKEGLNQRPRRFSGQRP